MWNTTADRFAERTFKEMYERRFNSWGEEYEDWMDGLEEEEEEEAVEWTAEQEASYAPHILNGYKILEEQGMKIPQEWKDKWGRKLA